MNVTITNLGPVKKANVALAPLTVFVGPNGTGKTLSAYILAGAFGHLVIDPLQKRYGQRKPAKTLVPMWNEFHVAKQRLVESGTAKLNIVDWADRFGDRFWDLVMESSLDELPFFLSTNRMDFSKTRLRFELGDSRAAWLANLRAREFAHSVGRGRSQKSAAFRIEKHADDPYVYFYTLGDSELPPRIFDREAVPALIAMVHQALFRQVYLFPTERTTYTATARVWFKHELESHIKTSKVAEKDDEATEPLVFRRILDQSYPVIDLIDTMTRALAQSQASRAEELDTEPGARELSELGGRLEQILGGRIDFSAAEQGMRRLLYQNEGGPAVEMTVASSMVKELAPLVLYLRYLALPGELVVIDEPEMNLHPAAQARLTELLAMMVNAGLKILFTTHSPYVLDHLTNLIKAAQSPRPESLASKFFLKSPDAFLQQDKVSVQFFDGGTCRSVLEPDGSIDWRTFGEVSDFVSNLYFEL